MKPLYLQLYTLGCYVRLTTPMSAQNNDPATSVAKAAKAAFEASQLIASSERVRALHELRDQLESAKAEILAANRRDLEVHLAPIPFHM